MYIDSNITYYQITDNINDIYNKNIENSLILELNRDIEDNKRLSNLPYPPDIGSKYILNEWSHKSVNNKLSLYDWLLSYCDEFDEWTDYETYMNGDLINDYMSYVYGSDNQNDWVHITYC